MALSKKSITLENQVAQQYYESLANYADTSGVLGYAIARNTRILQESLTEYLDIYREALKQYGEPQYDKDGNSTGTIRVSTANIPKLQEALKPFANIKHAVPICTLAYSDVIDQLTSAQLLALDFMLVDPIEDMPVETVKKLPNGAEEHTVSLPVQKADNA